MQFPDVATSIYTEVDSVVLHGSSFVIGHSGGNVIQVLPFGYIIYLTVANKEQMTDCLMVAAEEINLSSLCCTPHNFPQIIDWVTFSAQLLSPNRHPSS